MIPVFTLDEKLCEPVSQEPGFDLIEFGMFLREFCENSGILVRIQVGVPSNGFSAVSEALFYESLHAYEREIFEREKEPPSVGEEAPKGFKVVKGETFRKTILDSTHPDKKRAENRAATLRDSMRSSRYNPRRFSVWVLPMEVGDPQNYKKPSVTRGD